MKEQISEALKRLINDETQNIRAAFCRVITDNGDGTFDLEPLSGEPIIYDARTFESAVGFIKPLMDSIVSVQFYDNQNAYITNIIEYEDYTVYSTNSTSLASEDDLILLGKNMIIDSRKEINEQTINDSRDQWSRVDDGSITINAEQSIDMGAKDTFINSSRQTIVGGAERLNLESSDRISILAEEEVRTRSKKIIWNAVDMIILFKEVSNLLVLMDAKLQAIAADPAQLALVNQIKTKIDSL